jgi:LCP family protein required for cell wall assembly
MRKIVIIIGSIVAVLLCLAMIGGGTFYGVQLFTRPQAATLALTTATNAPATATALASKATVIVVPTESPTKAPQVCGQSGSWIILGLGRTIHKSIPPAEMLRLMKVDFDHKSAVIYAFPPDLVVETPGLTEKYNIQTSRLQDIFTALVIADGESKTTEINASQATAQAILDNFGIAADHYFTVKEDIVQEMVNIVGGIDVTLSQDFTMPSYSKYEGLVLKAGKQHLDGEMVHAITTYRTSAEEESYRLANQNIVLAGMWKKLLDPAVYVKIPQLYSSYQDNVTTDLSLEQFAALSCLSRLIPAENITVDTPSIEQLIVKEDGSTYMKNPELLIPEIQALFSAP